MNLAIISITSRGKIQANKLKNTLETDPTILKIDLYHKNVKNTLNTIYKDYDAILGIMATGIMIRSLGDLIDNKTTDPAILVMDEGGFNIISLLSGHLGGANNLTNKIANLIDSNPVITTATDVNGILSIDELARKYFWKIENTRLILSFNRALLNGKNIKLSSSMDLTYLFEDPEIRKEINKTYLFKKIEKNKGKDNSKKFNEDSKPVKNDIFKNKESIQIFANVDDGKSTEELILRPRKLVVGLGSRKGVSKDQVLRAIKKTFDLLELPLNRIDAITTAEIKNKEEGILETAEYLQVPLKIVSLQDINDENNHDSNQCSNSKFVNEKFGIKGVCEPAALISAGKNSKLIFRKTAYNGVTVAVAISK